MASVESVLRDLRAADERISHGVKDLAELAGISEDETRTQIAALNEAGLIERKDSMSTQSSPVPLRVTGYLG